MANEIEKLKMVKVRTSRGNIVLVNLNMLHMITQCADIDTGKPFYKLVFGDKGSLNIHQDEYTRLSQFLEKIDPAKLLEGEWKPGEDK